MNTVLECLEGQTRNNFEGLILNKVKLSQEDYLPYSPDLPPSNYQLYNSKEL
jgi:hypothetical protein